jgi:hypothetical protein
VNREGPLIGLLGVNVGKNKETADADAKLDYATGVLAATEADSICV